MGDSALSSMDGAHESDTDDPEGKYAELKCCRYTGHTTGCALNTQLRCEGSQDIRHFDTCLIHSFIFLNDLGSDDGPDGPNGLPQLLCI